MHNFMGRKIGERPRDIMEGPGPPGGTSYGAPPGFFYHQAAVGGMLPDSLKFPPPPPPGPPQRRIVSCSDLESALLTPHHGQDGEAGKQQFQPRQESWREETRQSGRAVVRPLRLRAPAQPPLSLQGLPAPPLPGHCPPNLVTLPQSNFNTATSRGVGEESQRGGGRPPPGFQERGFPPFGELARPRQELRAEPQPWSPARPKGPPPQHHSDWRAEAQQNSVMKKLFELSAGLKSQEESQQKKRQSVAQNMSERMMQRNTLQRRTESFQPDRISQEEAIAKANEKKNKKKKKVERNKKQQQDGPPRETIGLEQEPSNKGDIESNNPVAAKGEKESKKKELKKRKKKNKGKEGEATGGNDGSGMSGKEEDQLVSGTFSKVILSKSGEIVRKDKTEPITSENKNSNKARKKRWRDTFEKYLPERIVKEGLAEKTLVQGEFRINQKKYTEAYVTEEETGLDILVQGLTDRNRALEGDIVVVEMKEEEDWAELKDGVKTKTGKVVYIVERVHHGMTVGSLQRMNDGSFFLIPRDSKFPRLKIPTTSIPLDVLSEFSNGCNKSDKLFTGLLLSWCSPRVARGMIQETIGTKGDLDAETVAILSEWGLSSHNNAYSQYFDQFLPKLPFVITEDEISSRLDLRSEVIFTIDPETARDLDDAVSIKKISDGIYEVGVHISDVSHFLKLGNDLDIEVSKRATTVYMVEKAYHMLPLVLCGLCSLLPGEDKLAVSVIFKLDQEGNVLDTKFTRSVINSCVQLSYDHAQAVIDGLDVELPPIHNDVPASAIKEAIVELNKIAMRRQKRRFDTGALKLDQPKVCFNIDMDRAPKNMFIYEIKQSNKLIEEYMLLANEAVARFIYSKFPEIALLRRHDPPKPGMMEKLVSSLEKLDIFLDIRSAGHLHQTLSKYMGGDLLKTAVLNQLCSKPMTRAMYFCNSEDTHHYALNVDKYTHFTSPIRRYADIVVHRVLMACLGYTEPPPWTDEDVEKYAKTSNRKKYAAKKANDMSCDLFRSLYIREVGEVLASGVIYWVNSQSIDVTVPSMAFQLRVYLDDMEFFDFIDDDSCSSLSVKWSEDNVQILKIFSVVELSLTYCEDSRRVRGKLLPPGPDEDILKYRPVEDSPLAASRKEAAASKPPAPDSPSAVATSSQAKEQPPHKEKSKAKKKKDKLKLSVAERLKSSTALKNADSSEKHPPIGTKPNQNDMTDKRQAMSALLGQLKSSVQKNQAGKSEAANQPRGFSLSELMKANLPVEGKQMITPPSDCLTLEALEERFRAGLVTAEPAPPAEPASPLLSQPSSSQCQLPPSPLVINESCWSNPGNLLSLSPLDAKYKPSNPGKPAPPGLDFLTASLSQSTALSEAFSRLPEQPSRILPQQEINSQFTLPLTPPDELSQSDPFIEPKSYKTVLHLSDKDPNLSDPPVEDTVPQSAVSSSLVTEPETPSDSQKEDIEVPPQAQPVLSAIGRFLSFFTNQTAPQKGEKLDTAAEVEDACHERGGTSLSDPTGISKPAIEELQKPNSLGCSGPILENLQKTSPIEGSGQPHDKPQKPNSLGSSGSTLEEHQKPDPLGSSGPNLDELQKPDSLGRSGPIHENLQKTSPTKGSSQAHDEPQKPDSLGSSGPTLDELQKPEPLGRSGPTVDELQKPDSLGSSGPILENLQKTSPTEGSSQAHDEPQKPDSLGSSGPTLDELQKLDPLGSSDLTLDELKESDPLGSTSPILDEHQKPDSLVSNGPTLENLQKTGLTEGSSQVDDEPQKPDSLGSSVQALDELQKPDPLGSTSPILDESQKPDSLGSSVQALHELHKPDPLGSSGPILDELKESDPLGSSGPILENLQKTSPTKGSSQAHDEPQKPDSLGSSVQALDELQKPDPLGSTSPILDESQKPDSLGSSVQALHELHKPDPLGSSGPILDELKESDPLGSSGPILENLQKTSPTKGSSQAHDEPQKPDSLGSSVQALDELQKPDPLGSTSPILDEHQKPDSLGSSGPTLDELQKPHSLGSSGPTLDELQKPDSLGSNVQALDELQKPDLLGSSGPTLDELQKPDRLENSGPTLDDLQKPGSLGNSSQAFDEPQKPGFVGTSGPILDEPQKPVSQESSGPPLEDLQKTGPTEGSCQALQSQKPHSQESSGPTLQDFQKPDSLQSSGQALEPQKPDSVESSGPTLEDLQKTGPTDSSGQALEPQKPVFLESSGPTLENLQKTGLTDRSGQAVEPQKPNSLQSCGPTLEDLQKTGPTEGIGQAALEPQKPDSLESSGSTLEDLQKPDSLESSGPTLEDLQKPDSLQSSGPTLEDLQKPDPLQRSGTILAELGPTVSSSSTLDKLTDSAPPSTEADVTNPSSASQPPLLDQQL